MRNEKTFDNAAFNMNTRVSN